MSIVTKTGDQGTTGLMYGRRVSKCDPRVEAYGSVDELNAALGLARAHCDEAEIREKLLAIQRDLVGVMGELATQPEDLPRYRADGYACLSPELTLRLEATIREIESQQITFKGWATPGATVSAAALDVARTTCRRAERRIWGLQGEGQLKNQEILVYLNRLSDLLWLFARWVETRNGGQSSDAAAVSASIPSPARS